MSEIHHSFAVKKEVDEEFKEIMAYFGTDNKTDVFKRMIQTFMELVWKAEQYDRIAQDVLAHEVLKRYNNKDLKACTEEEF
jgi:hypothetical protein